MKLEIIKSKNYKETEVMIKCSDIDPNLKKAIDILQNSEKVIIAQHEKSTEKLKYDCVYYFESVDEQTFVYTSDKVYTCMQKLYELEEILNQTSFVRISKSCILNIDYLESVRTAFNGKLEALLANGEKVIINRHYVPEFKKKFGL